MENQKVIYIEERRSKTIVNVLEEFLDLAKQGKLSGMLFAIKIDHQHSSVGTCGDYTTDIVQALGASQRLQNFLGREDMCCSCVHKLMTK
jgi:hypothetical protein